MNQRSKLKSLNKLRSTQRKTITLSKETIVSYEFLNDQQLPMVIKPKASGLNLPIWVEENRKQLREKLHTYGALLFRGFEMKHLGMFEDTVRAISGDLLNYTERSSPRHSVKGKVYTSTDYPPNEQIFLHNEQSYNVNWCQVISFFCEQPSETGGETPLADTRKILKRLSPQVVETFKEKGYLYLRNFGDGFGLNWKTTFGTEDQHEVQRYCDEHGIAWEWKEDNRLRTRQIRPMIRRHPHNQQDVWFNHCTFFNVHTLPETVTENLIDEFEEWDLPNHTFYGDGSPIPLDVIKELQQAYLAEKCMFTWQKNDLLVVDNMLTSHARESFEGDRSILVAMSELTDNQLKDLDLGVSQP